jgi:hypothetical protein
LESLKRVVLFYGIIISREYLHRTFVYRSIYEEVVSLLFLTFNFPYVHTTLEIIWNTEQTMW